MVDADSAKIGDSKEEVGSIPADHSNMTKFESASNVGFRRVSAQLRRWTEEIRSFHSRSNKHRTLLGNRTSLVLWFTADDFSCHTSEGPRRYVLQQWEIVTMVNAVR